MPTLVTRKIRRPELPRSAKIVIAILAALVFHFLFLLLLAWILPHWPKAHHTGQTGPFRLTIIKSTPAPTDHALSSSDVSTPAPYIRTLDENTSEKAPDQPAFQSDKNTLEAAELAATGDKPLPTTQGKEIPAFDFDTRPFRLDKVAADAATAAPASPTDSRNPSKDKERHPKAATTAPDSKSKPAAQPSPTATPAGELASLKSLPSPTPQATPEEFPDVTPTPPPPEADPLARQSPANPATPSTVTSRGLPKRPGYQPETIQTKMAGAISNRGRPSVGALGTPFGRYNKAISDAVGMRWYYYVAQQADLISVGSVKVHFVISASGRVQNVKVVSGNANGVLADISEQAINEAEIPPIPPDVAATLSGNQMDMDFDFSMY